MKIIDNSSGTGMHTTEVNSLSLRNSTISGSAAIGLSWEATGTTTANLTMTGGNTLALNASGSVGIDVAGDAVAAFTIDGNTLTQANGAPGINIRVWDDASVVGAITSNGITGTMGGFGVFASTGEGLGDTATLGLTLTGNSINPGVSSSADAIRLESAFSTAFCANIVGNTAIAGAAGGAFGIAVHQVGGTLDLVGLGAAKTPGQEADVISFLAGGQAPPLSVSDVDVVITSQIGTSGACSVP